MGYVGGQWNWLHAMWTDVDILVGAGDVGLCDRGKRRPLRMVGPVAFPEITTLTVTLNFTNEDFPSHVQPNHSPRC
jgi:hypothetical protein